MIFYLYYYILQEEPQHIIKTQQQQHKKRFSTILYNSRDEVSFNNVYYSQPSHQTQTHIIKMDRCVWDD